MSKKKKIIIGIVALVVILIGVAIYFKSRPKPTNVALENASRKTLSQTISITGYIEPIDKYDVLFTTGQKINKVFVKEGDTVKKGQILFSLDTVDLNYQLQKSILNLDIAKINLQKSLETDNRGDKKNNINAVNQAQVNLDNSKRAYAEAKRKYNSTKALYDAGVNSKDELYNAERAAKDAENQVKITELLLQNAKNSLSDTDVNKNDQILQQQKQIQLAQADIDSFKQKISDSNVTARINGNIVKMDIKENQYPGNNSTLQIYDNSKYKLALDVSQYDSVLIKKNQPVSIKVKGLNRKYTGVISFIGKAAFSTTSGSSKDSKVRVEIVINNNDGNIRAGYEADGEITLKQVPNVVALGFDSIKQDETGKKFVFVVKNNKAVKKYIKTGLETDFDVEVVEGLKEGEKYIIAPPEGLKEGDAVVFGGGQK